MRSAPILIGVGALAFYGVVAAAPYVRGAGMRAALTAIYNDVATALTAQEPPNAPFRAAPHSRPLVVADKARSPIARALVPSELTREPLTQVEHTAETTPAVRIYSVTRANISPAAPVVDAALANPDLLPHDDSAPPASTTTISAAPATTTRAATTAGIPPGFDRAIAVRALSDAATAASRCGSGQPARGKFVVTFAPWGAVLFAGIAGKTPAADSSVGRCVAQALLSARMPPFGGGSVTVRFTAPTPP